MNFIEKKQTNHSNKLLMFLFNSIFSAGTLLFPQNGASSSTAKARFATSAKVSVW